MASKDLAMALVYLSHTIIGTLGNFSLLYHYIFLYVTKCRLRSTDQILKQLVLANSLAILFRGVPETMAAFGLKDFLSDLGCKLVFYVHRVGRGVSTGSTCLLSVFQVITISPGNSRWAELKLTAPKCIGIFSTLCWTLHMLLNTVVLMYMTDKWSHKNITYKKEFGYCSGVRHQKARKILYAALLSFPDAFSVGLMLWTSSSLVSILHRHKQRMRRIHKANTPHRSSPETRATRTVILLVSTFVCFYTLSSIFQALFILYNNPNRFVRNMAAVVTGGYPTVSPFLLMKHHPSISCLLLACVPVEVPFRTLFFGLKTQFKTGTKQLYVKPDTNIETQSHKYRWFIKANRGPGSLGRPVTARSRSTPAPARFPSGGTSPPGVANGRLRPRPLALPRPRLGPAPALYAFLFCACAVCCSPGSDSGSATHPLSPVFLIFCFKPPLPVLEPPSYPPGSWGLCGR
ncbi:vomeronasal type-1 receptor 4-like [Erethizon dorsatum]